MFMPIYLQGFKVVRVLSGNAETIGTKSKKLEQTKVKMR